MKAVSGKRFCRLLELRGWRLVRVRGSHHIYSKEGAGIRISVPVHGNTTLKIGLQRHLMKLANISEADL
ncbi:MAG: type II toxin-antitoxin system HicA family toxin [Acidimicrobiia bacterium]|nr:type II toxin-antitoxin system HicA family toxin [Acidimicrobiia bacterium]